MRKGILIAVVMALALAGWMLSGMLGGDAAPVATVPRAVTAPEAFPVQVRAETAQEIERVLVAQGQAEPSRVVTLRAEASGKIAGLPVKRGARVAEADIIVQIDLEDRKARLAEAQALVERYQRDYEASRQLAERGYQTDQRMKEAWADLQAARASFQQMQIELQKTTVHAPFDGVLDARVVELGDYLAVGDEIGTIVDNDPLKVAFQAPQKDIQRVVLGAVATIDFITGQSAPGVVTYVSARADPGTRTFRVEVEVPNEDLAIHSGISAETRLPLETVSAHYVSPALLSLDSSGVIGIKAVDEADVVRFHPVEIVRADRDGVWVSGAPDDIRLITVGQGFVRDGETVVPVAAAGEASAAARSTTD
jgi:multidrug efflux system membrane fusion protein